MLAATLFSTLAVLGTTMAAPANGDAFSTGNSTLLARAAVGDVPENWPINGWVIVDGKLVGTVEEDPAANPLADCKVDQWGKTKKNDLGEYKNAHIKCRQWTKKAAWDIRRMGSATNCGTENKTETWTLSEGQTTEFGVNANVEATFSLFKVNIGASFKKTSSKNQGYTKTVSCNPTFKDIKCRIAAQAAIEMETVEGWVRIPIADVDEKDKDKVYSNWQGVNADDALLGIDDQASRKNYRHVDYDNYPDGWNDWEGIGQRECVDIIDNKYYKAQLLLNK